MKNIYKYLIFIMVLVIVLVSIITSKYEMRDKISLLVENNKFTVEDGKVIESKDELEVSAVEKTSLKNPLNKLYKVGEEKAELYSLSYVDENLKVGDKLIAGVYASDQLYFIFRKSYPTISLEEMGVDSVEEAYLVKQLAIWEIGLRTGEALYGSELSKIDSIKNDMKLKDDTVFKKAKDLVNYIEEFCYNNSKNPEEDVNIVPTLTVNTSEMKSDYMYYNDGYVVGPYKYDVNWKKKIKSSVIATDENGNDIGAKIIESNGMPKTTFSDNDEFYVKCPNTTDDVKVTVEVEVKRLVPRIYEFGGTDYIANTYVINNMKQDLHINWL